MINEFLKWPTDKERYDREYLRIYGVPCKHCKTRGWYEDFCKVQKKMIKTTCIFCNGLGFKEKK